MDQNQPELTLCGRVSGSPLPNPRHELVAEAFVAGKTAREAGLSAGYKDGPGLKGNIVRLWQMPVMRERIAEIGLKSAEHAQIFAGWVLSDFRLFAKANLADFCKRGDDGKIVLGGDGLPQLHFENATEDQIRCVKELSYTKYGPKLVMHDPVQSLDRLARHLGLFVDKMALTDPSGKIGLETLIMKSYQSGKPPDGN